MGRLDGGLRAVLDLVLPVDCAGCAVPDVRLCPACRAPLTAAPVPVRRPGAGQVWTVARYEDRLARVVPAWKDRGRLDLTGDLAVPLARAVRALLAALSGGPTPDLAAAAAGPVLLVPVPSSGRAVRARGQDVVAELARRAARHLDQVGSGSALRVTRVLADQSGLGAPQRRANVAGAFAVRRPAAARVRGAACIVVDDVLTTGASATEAVRVLQAAGARVLGVATVCATPPPSRLSARNRSD